MSFPRAITRSLTLFALILILYAGTAVYILSFHDSSPSLAPLLGTSSFDSDKTRESIAPDFKTFKSKSLSFATLSRAMDSSQTPSFSVSINHPGFIISAAASSMYTSSSNQIQHSDDRKWQFQTIRDSKAYGLSKMQCEVAFPSLFDEIERGVRFQKASGSNITKDNIDISWAENGIVRAMIFDAQLYILEAKISHSSHATTRGLAILHAIHRAILTSPESLPNIEFSFSISDISDPKHMRQPVWALTHTAGEPEKWVMSDFGYWSWPTNLVGGYEQIRVEIAAVESGLRFADKKRQVLWRGALKTNQNRNQLLKVTDGKSWADVESVRWNSKGIVPQDSQKTINIAEHCQYQFLLQTEGRSYSGRGKYLHNCNSVVVIPKRTWTEPHHDLLVSSGPSQNFLEIEEDFSDLEAKMLYMLQNATLASQIAQNSAEVFRDRYLTPAAQACYWRNMIRSWAEVSFEPELWEYNSVGKKKIRGIPFETFALTIGRPECLWLGRMLRQC